jgi:DNA polymerase (family X)
MRNQEIANIFMEISDLLDLKGENVFRIRAYRRAAQNLAGFSRSIDTLSREELEAIPGIGTDLAAKILEYIATGKVAKHETLKKEFPAGILDLLRVPGIGPKTAKRLYKEKGVTGIAELEALGRSGNLAGLPGIGKKTEDNIVKGVELIKRGHDGRPLGTVLPIAEDIIRQIRKSSPIDEISLAGSIRRWKETVNDIDILATSRKPDKVTEAFIKLPNVNRILTHGPTKASVIADDGIQVDLRVVEEDSFGAALIYFTGSKQHNIKLREMAVRAGLKINEYGVFTEPAGERIGGRSETDVYKTLGLSFIAPELREDAGEIEAAVRGELPTLVDMGDIRGDLHVHTKWSDGSHDLDSLIQAARERNYRYIAVTDHTKGRGISRGLDEGRLAEQSRLIDTMNRKHAGFKVLKGTEVDIRSDGRLDLPDEALAGLDIVMASVHSGFKQTQEQIMNRLLSAIRNPCVNVIAHPTGRMIGERDPYAVDMEMLLKEAARYGVAMEINAYPLRLDLNDLHVKMAGQYGVPLIISTDTHVLSQLDTMIYGVAVARRGWAEKNNVLNALEHRDLIKRLKSCTKRKANRAKQ